MSQDQEIPLRIEVLSGGRANQFTIHSRKEILFILKGIEQKSSRAALYYNDDNNFLLTRLLAVSDEFLWLGASEEEHENKLIATSRKHVFISSHYQAKVQFVADRVEVELYNGRPALRIPVPHSMLRLQRRDYYRLTTPAVSPLKCQIPGTPTVADNDRLENNVRAVTVMDISVGGVQLVCEESETELHPGHTYPNCKIQLPDVGEIGATIVVRSVFEVTAADGTMSKRAGCEFVNLDGGSSMLLYRYITQMQMFHPEAPAHT